MKKNNFFLGILALTFLTFFYSGKVLAQDSQSSPPPDIKQSFFKGKVISLQNGEVKNYSNSISYSLQRAKIKIINGNEKNKVVNVIYDPQNTKDLRLNTGDLVIVVKQIENNNKAYYYINDKYRLPYLELAVLAFIIFSILVVGKKGIRGIIGFLFSIAVIFSYVVPQILKGSDPLEICFIASIIILFLSTYVAHGFSKNTTIAVISTFISLCITYFVSKFLFNTNFISGYGNSEAVDLRFSTTSIINVKNLLLGGIMIGTVGALNDVTTTQSATIHEIHDLFPEISFIELLSRSFNIGREHTISIINTLVLAYAGASLASFIFFMYNPQKWPYWVILNNEYTAEEIIKTIAGTFGLLLAVPIATILGSLVYFKGTKEKVINFLYKMR